MGHRLFYYVLGYWADWLPLASRSAAHPQSRDCRQCAIGRLSNHFLSDAPLEDPPHDVDQAIYIDATQVGFYQLSLQGLQR
jgi:hypothetical protein